MLIFNKYFLSFLIFIILFSSCKKDDPVYSINQIQANAYNANKTKLKSPSQFISILYANLFQKALSANELVEITRCIESVGDKELVHEVVISNFMNRNGVTLPSDSLMRADLEAFIEEYDKHHNESYASHQSKKYHANLTEDQKWLCVSKIKNMQWKIKKK